VNGVVGSINLFARAGHQLKTKKRDVFHLDLTEGAARPVLN
jgi:hypothetical protein